MEETPAFLRRAAEKCGFNRDHYVDHDLPTNPNNIVVAHLFADIRHEFVLSSLLLKRFCDDILGSKYIILCGWSGHHGFFPYVDEYWTPSGMLDQLRKGSIGFENNSEVYNKQRQNLNYFFSNIIEPEDIRKFYDNGLTDEFRNRLKVAKRFLPMVPSSTYLEPVFNRGLINRAGYKVFLMPMKIGRSFVRGKIANITSCKEFWNSLLSRLVKEGYCPVIVQSHMTFDLSGEFSDKAIFVQEEDISKIIGMMRTTGMVLDIFGGVSRWAIAARTPFVAVDERSRYAGEREYEIDDLCSQDLPKHYIFSFPTMLERGDPDSWNANIFDNIVKSLMSLRNSIKPDILPSTTESVLEVSLDTIRDHRVKRIGAKFVRNLSQRD